MLGKDEVDLFIIDADVRLSDPQGVQEKLQLQLSGLKDGGVIAQSNRVVNDFEPFLQGAVADATVLVIKLDEGLPTGSFESLQSGPSSTVPR